VGRLATGGAQAALVFGVAKGRGYAIVVTAP
jgi:hypothetical protein